MRARWLDGCGSKGEMLVRGSSIWLAFVNFEQGIQVFLSQPTLEAGVDERWRRTKGWI